MTSLSVFRDVPIAQKLEGSLLKIYRQDDSSVKMFLAYKVCMTEGGHPWVSLVVRKTRLQIAEDPSLNYEYLPLAGLKSFIQASLELLFGKHSQAIVEKRVGGVHIVGESGAFQLGAQFLKIWRKNLKTVCIISCQNEQCGLIFRDMGFTVYEYSVWNSTDLCSDPSIFVEVLQHIPAGSILVIGNISDCRFTQNQWTKLMSIIKSKQIFPFFDIPCQGLSTGDLEEDSKFLQHFVSLGFEFFCSQSLSKNFGIYEEPRSTSGAKYHLVWTELEAPHLNPVSCEVGGECEAESKRCCGEHHADQGEGEGETPTPGDPWVVESHHPTERNPWLSGTQLSTGGVPGQEEAYLLAQDQPDQLHLH
ncbi:putative aspartate aminotransferase, cytoplasmic 2 isoform X3 [Rattus norvegicus]|uniref:aspartate transaminase n=1 Tax=Rattus norvegicus TaxID=10116 RepID=A0A8I5ZVR3_RAT|nr:putative aspartate aminotransferase, cytoplasmic 2 isoform X6 [Rattus norvegicus]|eukprot:XP_006253356.1 PREDICTED: putative aspartate aminotransferase, cytoplasmic 2 isoform X6 [Rattus norvegicus]